MKDITTLFKALSDPTRRDILRLLVKRELTPSELLKKLDVSQPTLSHHLDILKRAELIEGERDGQFIRYALNMSVFEMAVGYLLQFKRRR